MGVPVPGYGKPLGTSLPAWAHPGYATTRVKPPWYPDLPTQSRRHGRSISSRPDLPTQSRRQSRLIISRLVSCRVPNRTANSNNRISRPIALANSAKKRKCYLISSRLVCCVPKRTRITWSSGPIPICAKLLPRSSHPGK